MDDKDFKNQIEIELKTINKNDIVFFSWICAVRALPYLCSNGNLNYWGDERMKHLYSIFRALDLSYQKTFLSNFYSFNPIIERKNSIYFDTNNAVLSAFAAAFESLNIPAYSYAASAAAYVAHSASIATTDTIDSYSFSAAADVVFSLSESISNNLTASSAYAPIRKNLLTDLKRIQEGQTTFDNHINFHGVIWKNFQQALKKEGCSYWGRLYEDVFKNSFQLDKEALERRMNVPPEIREHGAAAVASYLEELEKAGSKNLNEARIIILGEKGSGKTSLARRLINPNVDMPTDAQSTAGVDTTIWRPDNEDINAHIWDFGGHTVIHAVHQFFLSERCLYILVYDGRAEERNRIEYWLNQMKNYGGDSKVFILVNRRDVHSPYIPINKLKEKYPIAGYHIFSIKDDKNELEKFRMVIIEHIKNNPSWSNQMIPANYFNVKKELQQRFADNSDRNEEYIDIDEFYRIANKNKIEKIEELLKSLHALGICLRYENMAGFDTLVLNPEWISNGIYKIINWVHGQSKFSIAQTEFLNVFEKETNRFPKAKHRFLYELMKCYELAYETAGRDSLIIPHLMPEDRPDILPDFPVGDSLMLRYKAEQPLPLDTITRFIVRHNEDINQFLVWRYGVVLEDGGGSSALVREFTDEREITVSVKGDDRTVYLNKLRTSLNSIFNLYKSKKPDLEYRIDRFGQIQDLERFGVRVHVDDVAEISKQMEGIIPLWLPDSKIYNHFIDGRPYYDDMTGKEIYMNYSVHNYHITAESFIQGGQGNTIDRSIRSTFNFHNCNISLQGNLNDLASSLKRKGEAEEAEVLEEAAKALAEAEQHKTPEEIKKKGIAAKLKRIVDDLNNEDSNLSKTIKGIKHGISIAQDIAKGYNDIAQWIGLPQVPKPFLGKE